MKKTSISFFVFMALFSVHSLAGVSVYEKLAAELKKAQQQRDAKLSEIQAATKKQAEATKLATQKQREVVEATKTLGNVRANLDRMVESNAVVVVELQKQNKMLEEQLANLELTNRESELQREKIEFENEKLEHHRIVWVGATFAFLVTTIFSGIATKQSWRSAKLEDRKCRLEIVKLKRELASSKQAEEGTGNRKS